MCLALSSWLLTGCGPSSTANTEQDAVARLSAALVAYNASAPRDVAAAGAECRLALGKLQSASLLAKPPPAGKGQGARHALHETYVLAHAGFADCAAGAARMSYPQMAHAANELTDANAWIRQAKLLDR
ncbi:MAG TPA: hypothetical protein VF221_13950 [Chloroflexota bacterium]